MKIQSRFAAIASLAAAVLASTSIVATAAPAFASTTSSFSADYNTTSGSLDTSQLMNVSQGGYEGMKNLHWFPAQAAQMSSMGLQQVRIDHVFDDAFYHVVNNTGGTITYDFSALDKVLLPLLHNGLTPFISLSYMPAALGPSVYGPPTSNAAWADAVGAMVNHYKALGYTGWSWEFWNEPDGSFWSGSEAQYEATYAATAGAVKTADATALIGGLGVYSSTDGWLSNFISYLGANPTVPADFVSYHSYNSGDFSDSATVQSLLTSAGRTSTKIYVTEWNNSPNMTQGSGSGTDTNSSNGGSSFSAKKLFSAIGSAAAKVFFFGPVEGFTPDDAYNGDLGLVTVDGHRKSVGNVFQMYSQLDPTLLTTTINGTGTGTHDIYGLATKNASTGKATLLLWNNTNTDSTMSISLTSLPYAATDFRLTQTRVSTYEGDGYFDYGSGLANQYPSPNENAPTVANTVYAPATSYSNTITVPGYGVTELTFTPTTAATGSISITSQPTLTNLAASVAGTSITTSSSYEASSSGWGAAGLTDGRLHSFETVDAGNAVQGWSSLGHSSASATEYAEVNLGAAKTVNSVVLWPRDSAAFSGDDFPTAFTISGSTDNSTWTTLYSTSNYNNGNRVDGPQTFGFTPGSYEYIKVNATTLAYPMTEGGTVTYRFQLDELQVFNTGVTNGGFESGSTSGWSVIGTAAAESTVIHGGTYGVTVTGSGNGVQQTISGLSPNTSYTFGGYAKTAVAGDSIYVGVKSFGGAENSQATSSTSWSPDWVTFTTGATNTTAVVYLYKNSGSGQAWGDDFELVKNTTSSGANYVLTNRNSSLALDVVGGSTSDGALIDQWTPNGGANQEWQFGSASTTGYYTLISTNSNKCLDVPNYSTATGVQLDQWTCNGGTNQQWKQIWIDSTHYELQGLNSGLCVEVSGASTSAGAAVIQDTCSAAYNQQWSN